MLHAQLVVVVQSIDAQIERSRSAPTFRRLLRKKCAGDIVGGVLSVSPRLDPPPPPPPRLLSRWFREKAIRFRIDGDETMRGGIGFVKEKSAS